MNIRARAPDIIRKCYSREPEFQQAVEQSRWRAFPLGLAMVAEVADGVLRPRTGDGPQAGVEALTRDRAVGVRPLSGAGSALGATTGGQLRADLVRRLQSIGLHPPKRAMDIPEPYAQAVFRPDADPRETAGAGFRHHAELPQGRPCAISTRS